jgi:hypothetical protein
MTIRSEFEDIGHALARMKYQVMGIKVELKLRRLSISTKDGFDPDQPRDDRGRWTDGDGAALAKIICRLLTEKKEAFVPTLRCGRSPRK